MDLINGELIIQNNNNFESFINIEDPFEFLEKIWNKNQSEFFEFLIQINLLGEKDRKSQE